MLIHLQKAADQAAIAQEMVCTLGTNVLVVEMAVKHLRDRVQLPSITDARLSC